MTAVQPLSLAQLVGYLAYVIAAAAFWQKHDRKLFIFNGLAACCWVMHYGLLHEMTGVLTEFLVVLRSFAALRSIGPWHKHLLAAVLLLAFSLIGVFSFHHWYDLWTVAACMIGTISMLYFTHLPLRYGMLASLGCWLFYNFYAGSIGGVLSAVTFIGVQLATIFRLRREMPA